MSRDRFTALTPGLQRYIVEQGTREDGVLARLRERTALMGDVAVMQVAPDQGALLTLLARSIGARRAIEVGTFTGYSAICIVRGLADGGILLTCELEEERARIAREAFAEAGISDRVDLRVGPAERTLGELEGSEPFDLAFIDADKTSYPAYYEACLRLLRPGGLLLIDNVLLGGRVVDPAAGDEGARAVAELNRRIHGDERVDLAMIGLADGVTLARKR